MRATRIGWRWEVAYLCLGLAFLAFSPASSLGQSRATKDLVSLYTFEEGQGDTIRDRAGGSATDLKIQNTKAVRWQKGYLEVRDTTLIATPKSAKKIIDALRRSNQITIEAWIRPANASQGGPARIVSLSADSGQRNFTLGQEKNIYDVRLRTTSTDTNGMPSLASPGGRVKTNLTHVVYTRDSGGTARLYIDGKQHASKKVGGNFSKWDNNFRFSLANEITKDRTWKGQLHLVAIYSRALSSGEVTQNFKANGNVVVASNDKPKPPPPKPAPSKPKKTFALKSIKLPSGGTMQKVDFERHVIGLLSRYSCNSGSCHGSFQGQGDLRFSLFGHDPSMDFKALTDPDQGPRVDGDDPAESLALLKPSGIEDHGGEKRFDKDSWAYQVIWNWVASGAEWKEGSGEIKRVTVSPSIHRFNRSGETGQLKVLAEFADGSKEDVTPFSDFRINDDYVAEISPDGELRALHPGDTAIVVTYRGHVLSAQAIVPATVRPGFRYPRVPEVNGIDREVLAKLRGLKIVPSEPASGYQFLRRVYIDTIGQLPSPDEVRKFVADKDPNKRDKKIDELLSHKLHAALWATKFCDITGNNSDALEQPREKRSKMWHDWFRRRLERNVKYDELVKGVLVATSREGKSPDDWIKETRELDEKALTSFDSDYAERDSLDLFWSRRNFGQIQMAEQTAAAFMGVRIQCAQCHKHPYDRWTQEDYRSYANVFGQVKNGTSSDAKKAIDDENRRRRGVKDRKKRLANLREIYVDAGRPSRMNHPQTNQALKPKALGGPEIETKGDYRADLFEWLKKPDNPFFARSFVNRIWAHYFGVGIVDPVDDFSVANPPSNEPLLAYLAEEFVKSDFDIRHVERLVLRSRTYQLSSAPNETNLQDRRNFSRSYPRKMMAEQVVDVINSALETEDRFTRDAPKGSQAIEVAGSRVQDGNLAYVFRIFGRPERALACDCERSSEPALPQTLYCMTDTNVQNKIANGRLKNLLSQNDRLKKLREKKLSDVELEKIVDELFLATLTRLPDEREKRAAVENVRRKDGSEKGLHDVVWALINTREFILNH